ncbi:MAG: porin family protein [Crocinitomicaceae bacterium]|nr:porin family protein [Crocinitomicaceae bacterium]
MRLLLALLFLSVFTASAQIEKPKNYRRFDEKLIHFGFMLGANTSNFTLYQRPNAYEQFGLKSITTKSGIGGQVGVVATLKLGTPVVRLRLVPTLSFQEKILRYTFDDPDTTLDIFNEERVNSTNIDIPLMFQFRTLRVNNFAAYVLIGAQFSIDLQSQEDDSQDFIDPYIKTKQYDWQGQVGAGVEFFAPYFKFGLEVKYSHGFINVFVPESTTIGAPLDRLYNNAWWFSIIFEG